jgi:hypothetical protein
MYCHSIIVCLFILGPSGLYNAWWAQLTQLFIRRLGWHNTFDLDPVNWESANRTGFSGKPSLSGDLLQPHASAQILLAVILGDDAY